MANFGLIGNISGLMLLTLCILVGGLAFEVLVLRMTKIEALREHTQLLRLRWLSGWVIAMMMLSGVSVWLLALPVWILVVRLLMGSGILLLLSAVRPVREQWRTLAIGVLLLQTQSFISRSAHLPRPVVPLLADWFHLTLAAVWLGGVAMLALIIARVWRDPSRETILAVSGVLQRFSLIAMFCVLGLAASGVAQAGLFLNSFADLLRTPYGITLLIKLALFVMLIGFGAFHRQRIMPMLRDLLLRTKLEAAETQSRVAVAQLRWSLLLESGVGVLVLLVVGLLTTLPLSFNP